MKLPEIDAHKNAITDHVAEAQRLLKQARHQFRYAADAATALEIEGVLKQSEEGKFLSEDLRDLMNEADIRTDIFMGDFAQGLYNAGRAEE